MTQTNGMKLRIGVVGCGNISLAYMRNAPLFRDVEIVACADLNADATKRRAAEFDLRAADVDSLIDDKNIDLILNLTIPAAHFDVSMRALSAGKHVFTEKPLGVTAAEGRRLVDAAALPGPHARLGARHVPGSGRTPCPAADGRRRHRQAGDRNSLHDGARHGALASGSQLLLPGFKR